MPLTKKDVQDIKNAFNPYFTSLDAQFKSIDAKFEEMHNKLGTLATRQEMKAQLKDHIDQIHRGFRDTVELIYQAHPTRGEFDIELQEVKSRIEELEERLEKVEKLK